MKSERLGRFRKLAGNEFQAVGAIKQTERAVADRFEIAYLIKIELTLKEIT